MNKIYIFSDAHFGSGSAESEGKKAKYFFSLVDRIRREGADLVINGDLFDFWFEYKYAIPRFHFSILSQLSLLTSSGINVHYVAGNHDFWLDSFMTNEIGITLHDEEMVICQDDFHTYIRHGDGLLKSDHLYRFLKKILRHPLNIKLYRMLHPDIGMPLALYFSHLSRDSKKDKQHCDEDYRRFAFDKIDQDYRIVVLGHTHRPTMEKYKDGWYLNTGNWMETFTYAIIENGTPELLAWNGTHGVEYQD